MKIIPISLLNEETGEEMHLNVSFKEYEGESEHAFQIRIERGLAAFIDYVKHKGELPK